MLASRSNKFQHSRAKTIGLCVRVGVMRSVFAAVAIGLMTAGQAGASSFVIAEAPVAIDPAPAAEVASVEVNNTSDSPSIIVLGEPEPVPVASTPAASVDDTATASVGEPAPPGLSEHNRIMTAWAQAEADAAWAKFKSIQTQSIMYVGRPLPLMDKAKEKFSAVAAIDVGHNPMVMRGGIFGDLFPSADAVEGDADKPSETTAAAPTSGKPVAMTREQEAARAAERAKKREATPTPKRPAVKLTPSQQRKVLPNG